MPNIFLHMNIYYFILFISGTFKELQVNKKTLQISNQYSNNCVFYWCSSTIGVLPVY